MKERRNVKNDDVKIHEDVLTELPVADRQADETKGGRRGQTDDYAIWQSNYGVSI